MAVQVAIFLTACVCAFVGAQDSAAPKPCSTPDQWTGTFGDLMGYSEAGRPRPPHPHPRDQMNQGVKFGEENEVDKHHRRPREGLVAGVNNITYDYTNKRLALRGLVFHRGQHRLFDMIADYKKKKAYIVHLEKKKCAVFQIKKPMHKFSIPAKARYGGSITLGAGANTLKVDSWMVAIKNRRMRVGGSISVAAGCIPVGEQMVGQVMRKRFMTTVGYFNISPGVRDPKVFNPPSYCKKKGYSAAMIEEEEPSLMGYMFHRFTEV